MLYFPVVNIEIQRKRDQNQKSTHLCQKRSVHSTQFNARAMKTSLNSSLTSEYF